MKYKNAKTGISTIVDFKEDGGIYSYVHEGGGVGESNGATYSVGIVENFNKPEDYSKHFADISVGNVIGLDHCYYPLKEYSKTIKAVSITFGSGRTICEGYDYYSPPLVIKKWEVR